MFIPPATSITAANWNTIFQAADTQLTTALGGLSAVLCGADKPFDRGFFFFDPLNVAPTALHPMAANFLTNYWGQLPVQPPMCLRSYSHNAILSAVNSLAVLATSSKFGVVKLAKPGWAAWAATVYPSGFGTINPNTLYDANGVPEDNILDCSLGVITVGGNAVTFNDVTTAEHAQPLKPIDIFINGSFTWDSVNWNKYSVVRVHNLGTDPHAVFGTALNAGASRCFRLVAGAWQAQGNYFHWMASGDGRFLQMREGTGGAASIFQPGVVIDVLAAVQKLSTTNYGGYFDPAKFWDLSGIYNNPSYSPTSTEKTPPTGGYFAALSSASLIGDLLVHRGQVMAYQSNTNHPTFNFTGFANLATALAAAGMNSRALSQPNPWISGQNVNNLEIYAPGALIDLSSPLVTFITGGAVQAKYPGASQSSNPPSITLPMLLWGALDVRGTSAGTQYSYYNYSIDSSGNYHLGSIAQVTVTNAGLTVNNKQTVFLPTDTVAAAENWINATITGGGLVGVQNFTLLSTPFGPVLLWDELWPLDAHFGLSPSGLLPSNPAVNCFITQVALDQTSGNRLRCTRAVFLNDTWSPDGVNRWNGAVPYTSGVFPPRAPAATAVLWNFPRADQQYRFVRWFLHNPADAPMMPNWSAYFATSNYADSYYVADLASYFSDGRGGWACDDLRAGRQWNTVISFYESAPVSVDAPTLGAALTPPQSPAGQVLPKTGISAMRAWTPGPDAWAPFATLLGGQSIFYWDIAPDLAAGGAVNYLSLNWTNLVSNLTANTSPGQLTPNVLPCQAEHFNAIASLVSGQPPMRLNLGQSNLNGATTYTLNFAAANIIIVSGGSGHHVGDALNFNLKVAAVNAGGAITAVAQNGAAAINSYDAYSTPVRPFALDGAGATCDTSSGDGSQLTFIPVYAPIGVQIPVNDSPALPALLLPAGAQNAWPRKAFFAWNGPTPGGADPLGDYLAPYVTVQTTLPDGYGAQQLNTYVGWNNGAATGRTGGAGDWMQGFTDVFQVQALTYRWISIDDARNIYAAFSLSFQLNACHLPASFQVATASTSDTSIPPPDQIIPYANTPEAYQSILNPPPTYNNYETNSKVAGFINDAGGNWLCDGATGVIANAPMLQNWAATRCYYATRTLAISAATQDPNNPSWVDWTETLHIDLHMIRLDWGLLDPVMLGTVNAPATCVAYLREGLPDLCVAALPQNYAHLDSAFVMQRDAAYTDTGPNSPYISNSAPLGTQVIPYFADNTVESDPSTVTVVTGAGGVGNYDHPVTTALANARIVAMPIDGRGYPPAIQSAGDPSPSASFL